MFLFSSSLRAQVNAIELIYEAPGCTSVTFSENIIPEKSISKAHKPLNALHN